MTRRIVKPRDRSIFSISFSGNSIPQILDGQKDQTRRPAKLPKPLRVRGWEATTDLTEGGRVIPVFRHTRSEIAIRCPYGQVGDRLWVKEAFAYSVKDHTEALEHEEHDPDHHDIVYRADSDGHGEWIHYDADGKRSPMAPPWRSPRFMPRWASRMIIELTQVRAQFVQDISEEDARREGVERDTEPCDHTRLSCEEIGCLGQTHRSGFCELWEKLHGPGAWEKNGPLWALTFKIVEGGAKLNRDSYDG